LPPGDYRLEANGHNRNAPNLEMADFRMIKLTTEQSEFDCGFLELVPPSKDWIEDAKKDGTWREFTERYGEPCPAWHIVDARGVKKDVQASDFKGKWLLVYFYGTSCGPCLEKTIPKLRGFYEAHKAQRDRFELISICNDLDGQLRTMADLDQKMKPVVKAIWSRKELPFPVMLANGGQTMAAFGVQLFGATLLIDPSGRIVQGDELTLSAILDEGQKLKSK
jgi:peroxiredoxin